jgi:hypothetical protein
MTPDSTYICQGSEHGTVYIGWGGSARYRAAASPLACRLEDRTSSFPPVSQGIDRRRWVQAGAAYKGIDESGRRFY